MMNAEKNHGLVVPMVVGGGDGGGGSCTSSVSARKDGRGSHWNDDVDGEIARFTSRSEPIVPWDGAFCDVGWGGVAA